jgi:hypothetical protein
MDDHEGDFPIAPPPRKRPPAVLWVVLAAGGLLAVLFLGVFFMRSVREAEMATEARAAAEVARVEARAQAVWVMADAEEKAARAEAQARDEEARTAWAPGQAKGAQREVPVDDLAARLPGSRLEGAGEWSFSATGFVLMAAAEPIPVDLAGALLGPNRTAGRIEGRWRLDAADRPLGGTLVLTGIRGDGLPGLDEAKVPIVVKGRRWVVVAGHEYDLKAGKR